jgi:hypothetical protein
VTGPGAAVRRATDARVAVLLEFFVSALVNATLAHYALLQHSADLFHSPPLLPLLPFSDVRARCLLRKTLFSSSVIGRKSVVNTKTQIVLELTVILNVTFQMCLSINCVFSAKDLANKCMQNQVPTPLPTIKNT